MIKKLAVLAVLPFALAACGGSEEEAPKQTESTPPASTAPATPAPSNPAPTETAPSNPAPADTAPATPPAGQPQNQ